VQANCWFQDLRLHASKLLAPGLKVPGACHMYLTPYPHPPSPGVQPLLLITYALPLF
jgi:hypothetical protein